MPRPSPSQRHRYGKEHARERSCQEFQEAGHIVRLASNGREALNSVREEKPGLVVLDVMMPEMSGFDVAAILKNDPATMDIPIIIFICNMK